MKFKGIKFPFLSIVFFVFGCGDQKSIKNVEISLPYQETCSSEITGFYEDLGALRENVNHKVYMPQLLSVEGDFFNGVIVFEVPEDLLSVVMPSLNKFSYDCGPNTVVSVPVKEIADDRSLMRAISPLRSEASLFSENFYLTIEGDQIFVYFNRD